MKRLAPAIQNLQPQIKTLEAGRFADKDRGTTTQRGYGWQWVKLRKLALERDKYQCQECKRNGRVTPAQDVDHILNKASGGDDALSNLQALCRDCHVAKTQRESRG